MKVTPEFAALVDEVMKKGPSKILRTVKIAPIVAIINHVTAHTVDEALNTPLPPHTAAIPPELPPLPTEHVSQHFTKANRATKSTRKVGKRRLQCKAALEAVDDAVKQHFAVSDTELVGRSRVMRHVKARVYRRFLMIAGLGMNYTQVAEVVGVDPQPVQDAFELLRKKVQNDNVVRDELVALCHACNALRPDTLNRRRLATNGVLLM